MNPATDRSALFRAGEFRAVELGAEDVPWLQRFFEENPEYFFAVGGQPAQPNEAHEEIHGELPPGWPFTKKWLLGFCDPQGSMIAMANVTSDLLAPHVWHIGLFVVATRLHGSGVARLLYGAIEIWMQSHGADWLRLGVVQGNARAERFWESAGYVETRTRENVEIGVRNNTLRVMAKPLAAGTLEQYLAMMPRDRPGT